MTPAVGYNCGTTGEFPAVEWSSTVKRIAKGQIPVLNNLVAQAALAKAAAALLVDEARSEISTRRRIASSISVLENNGDCLVRENAAFFAAQSPPSIFSHGYQPEDLWSLTSCLDDVLDAIEEAAFRLSAYQFAWLAEGIPQSCLYLKTCTEGIFSALDGLVNRDDIPAESLEISNLAGRGDLVLRKSICDLFSSDGESMTVFTNKEICSTLSEAFSFCKSAIRQLLILESSSV
jgi:uncharacterized protein Yka (UPF0111/DUF47 family)